ncbi:MAG: elongation factor Ts [Patiriisocius sp.]|jgi:elongation factor Ts
MGITAADVNKLRKQTGAGMMDCKNALVEASGDFDNAIQILRKKGQKVAAKRGDRDATEGAVISKTSSDGKTGVIVRLNCETDFVAKNDSFIEFVTKIANIALENNVQSLDELKTMKFDEMTISEKIIEQTGVIGEKLDLSAFDRIESETVFGYIHPGNSVAALVGLNKEGRADEAKDVAMQVAAMSPLALNREGISQDIIDKEIELGKEMAIKEGKPAEMAEKIAMGRLNKFFKEVTLLDQQYIKDNKKSISQYLEETESGLTVTDFKKFSLS